MKKGELEAKKILEKLGEQFDEDYHDDNSKSSMFFWYEQKGSYCLSCCQKWIMFS